MRNLEGSVALVTGAGSGVGRAIAIALGSQGANVVLVGRNRDRLQQAANEVQAAGGNAQVHPADLTIDDDVHALATHHRNAHDRLDILVHSAGIFSRGPVAEVPVRDFDRQYRTNLRAPYVLTQHLLPLLVSTQGQIVFINSTAGLQAAAGVSQYAATKHGLKALADSLRAELNAKGVRVLSVFLGRTATPMQQHVCRLEGRDYHPDNYLQPKDVGRVILNAIVLPASAEITNLVLRPMNKTS